jgi:hypothetical protein
MGEIADGGCLPIRKQGIPSIPMDARMVGNNIANAVIAQAMVAATTWKTYAAQLIVADVSTREQFVKSIDAWLKECRKVNAESMGTMDKEGKANPTKEDTKLAGQRVNSATVEVSKLRTVANAFNSGADIPGLIAHFGSTQRLSGAQMNQVSMDDIGYTVIVEYARRFSESKAGRKADIWMVKFAKWLEKNPAPEDDSQGQAMHKAALALFDLK